MSPDLQRALDDLTESVAGMTEAQIDWRPAGKWSTAQILEHLLLAFRSSGVRLERALKEGASQSRPDTLGQRLGAFVVVTLGYFPTGRPAPEYVQPKGMAARQVLEDTRTALAEFDALASRCAERFGEHAKVSNHPILGAFSIRQWRRFHRIHTRHHMKQVAERRRQQQLPLYSGSAALPE